MSKFDGKVALITGASRGIGRALADRLALDGAPVVVSCSSSVGLAEKVVGGIIKNGARALALQADIGSVGELHQLFKDTVNHFGRLDILVKNAAIIDPIKPAIDVAEEESTRLLA